MKPRLLIIAGSDSSGGAGIQADIKTAAAHGVYAATAITALTVQNTLGVSAVHAAPPAIVAAQIAAVLDDIGADVIKTGMLVDAPIIQAIADMLDQKAKSIPRIVDPVMVAKGGAPLLDAAAVDIMKRRIIPGSALVTPNAPEAGVLTGRKVESVADLKMAAEALVAAGARAALLKGGHLSGDSVTDILYDGVKFTEFTAPRQTTRSTHGTGCTLASAIASHLALGKNLTEAVTAAHAYVQGALKHAPDLGHGHGPLAHDWMQTHP